MKNNFLRLFIIMFTILFSTAPVLAGSISDIKGHWAEDKIEKMVLNGIIVGYENGTFKPDSNVTRAEFCIMVNRAFNKYDENARADFSDVKQSDWFYKQVASSKEAGLMQGYPGNIFRPTAFLNREEASVVIVKAIGKPVSSNVIINFNDSGKISSWANDSIVQLSQSGVISGYPDGEFKPERTITRAEAVSMLLGAMKLVEDNNAIEIIDDEGKEIIEMDYSISYFNKFVVIYKIDNCDLANANYFNLIGRTSDGDLTVKLSENPVSINGELKTIGQMLGNMQKVTIEFYSDSSGINRVARGTISEPDIPIGSLDADDIAKGTITVN